jgi:hypothetical protein
MRMHCPYNQTLPALEITCTGIWVRQLATKRLVLYCSSQAFVYREGLQLQTLTQMSMMRKGQFLACPGDNASLRTTNNKYFLLHLIIGQNEASVVEGKAFV